MEKDFPLLSRTSNLGYILAGLIGCFTFTGLGVPLFYFFACLCAALLGIGSWMYHEYGTDGTRKLDNGGMILCFGSIALYYLSILLPVAAPLVALIPLIIFPLYGTYRGGEWYKYGRWALYGNIGIIVGMMFMMGFGHPLTSIRGIIVALGIFGFAFLYQGKEFNAQEGGVLRSKYHGIWHILTAVGIGYLIAYPLLFTLELQ